MYFNHLIYFSKRERCLQKCRCLLRYTSKGCGIMQTEIRLNEVEELISRLEDENGEAVKKAVNYTVRDIKSRAPGWIAAEVSTVYNIKKTEITPAKTDAGKDKKAVSIHTSGTALESVSIVYKGRALTPIHFSMSPKRPRKQKTSSKIAIPGSMLNFTGGGSSDVGMVSAPRKYAISYEIVKGKRWKARGKQDYSAPFLAPVKAGSDKYIVFQRKGSSRTNMYSVRTVSVPQMIENKNVYDKINKKIGESAEQRLQHHLDRFL